MSHQQIDNIGNVIYLMLIVFNLWVCLRVYRWLRLVNWQRQEKRVALKQED